MPRWRGQLENVYFGQCMRCGTRNPLSVMEWQGGLLLCRTHDCIDTSIVGSRDLAVARAVSINRHELEPDPKLYQIKDPKQDLEETPDSQY